MPLVHAASSWHQLFGFCTASTTKYREHVLDITVHSRITVPAVVSSRVLIWKIASVRTTTTSKRPELRFVGHPPDQCCTTKKLTSELSIENTIILIVCSA